MKQNQGAGKRSRREPVLPKVQKIEVSEKHVKLRVILIAVFLLIGVVALTFGVVSLLKKDTGWREIEPDSSAPALSYEFILQYNLGSSGMSATAEYRAITEIYSKAGRELYELLDLEAEYQGVVNLYTLNHTPNCEFDVDPRLYQILERMEQSGQRYLYLQPIYTEYDGLFSSGEDSFAALRDPYRSEGAREEIAELLRYGNDSSMIRLELLGDCRVCLHVAEEYLAFAEQHAVESLIGLGWLKNAAIIDALAEALSSSGYVYGVLTSYDGYTRNLDTATQTVYGYHYFDRYENGIYDAATFHYSGDMAIVDLRAFAIREADDYRMYIYRDGTVAIGYVDPTDGYYRYAANGLLAYSDTNDCLEIALKIAPIFLAQTLDDEALAALKTEDIDTIYCNDGEIFHSGTDFSLLEDSLWTDETITYRYHTVQP